MQRSFPESPKSSPSDGITASSVAPFPRSADEVVAPASDSVAFHHHGADAGAARSSPRSLVEELHGRVSKLDKSHGCPTPVILLRDDRRLLLMKGCGRRLCSVCGERWLKRVRKRMFMGFAHADGAHQEWTLTAPSFCDDGCTRYSPHGAGVVTTASSPLAEQSNALPARGHSDACVSRCREWNKGAAGRFNRLMQDVRRTFPAARIEYVRATELQARGAIHYHLALRGLPYWPEEARRPLVVSHGFGWNDTLRHNDTQQHTVWYLTKYFLKMHGARAWRERAPIITFSRGWLEPGEWKPALGSGDRFSWYLDVVDAVRAMVVPLLDDFDVMVQHAAGFW